MSLSPRMFVAGGTVAGLGALAAIALAAGGQPTPTKTVAPVAATPQVRTEVVRTTIHVTKREKPKTTVAAPAAAPVTAPAAPPVASSPQPTAVRVAQRVRQDDDLEYEQEERGDDHGEDGFEADDDHGGDDD
ncbi:MAG: hypothetical protein JHC95_18865 [Solirubrobacteraceae bacterium]|nr:hypothetical protein [Solirubrobacteraceae bacterium]